MIDWPSFWFGVLAWPLSVVGVFAVWIVAYEFSDHLGRLGRWIDGLVEEARRGTDFEHRETAVVAVSRYVRFGDKQPEVGQVVRLSIDERRPRLATCRKDRHGYYWQLEGGDEVVAVPDDRWRPYEEAH